MDTLGSEKSAPLVELLGSQSNDSHDSRSPSPVLQRVSSAHVERYINASTRKVAVLISPGYGAGWSTWAGANSVVGEDVAKEIAAFDRDIVKAVIDGDLEERNALPGPKFRASTPMEPRHSKSYGLNQRRNAGSTNTMATNR